MVQRRKWLFDVADWRMDTRRMSTTEKGAYHELLIEYWSQGRLPETDAQLRRITGLDPTQWKRIRPALEKLFLPGWKHRRVEQDIKRADAFIKRQKANIRKRWHRGEQLSMPVDNTQGTQLVSFGPKSLKLQDPDHTVVSNLSKKESKPSLASSSFVISRDLGKKTGKASKELNTDSGSAPAGQPRQADPKSNPIARPPRRQAATPNRKRNAARQAWEANICQALGPIAYAEAIDVLASDPHLVDHITDAELRKPGAGARMAIEALRAPASNTPS